jgi:hypothetical protein
MMWIRSWDFSEEAKGERLNEGICGWPEGIKEIVSANMPRCSSALERGRPKELLRRVC